MTIVAETPVLFLEGNRGQKRLWQGRVLEDFGDYYTQMLWWSVSRAGRESHKGESTPEKVVPEKPKKFTPTYLIGEKERALDALQAMENLMRDKGYVTEGY